MNGIPTLRLCVGQCGIQLGTHCLESEQAAYTGRKEQANAPIILVDSETKVIRQASEAMRLDKASELLEERNIMIRQGGCGNNWARGRLLGREPFVIEGSFSSYCSLSERVLECVRRALEKLDSLSATILFHSLGGGTGSGLGTHLMELYRDELPKKYLYSVAVMPHSSGDSPLQNYNCLLSLPLIHEFTDACILLANDEIVSNDVISTPSTPNNIRSQSYSIQDVNTKFCRHLLGLLNPAFSLLDKKHQTTQFQDILAFLTPDNSHKFISINQVSSKTASLPYLLKQVLTQKLKLHSTNAREHMRTFSSVLISRGYGKEEAIRAHADTQEQVKRLLFPSRDHNQLLYSCSEFPFSERSSVTLGLNSSLQTDFFRHVITKSQCLLSQGAYLHWYDRYGVTRGTFQNSLEILEQIHTHYTGSV